MGEGSGHALAEVGGECGVAEGLDEEDGGGDVLVEEGKFVFVVHFSGAVPVYYFVSIPLYRKGERDVHGPLRPLRENSWA